MSEEKKYGLDVVKIRLVREEPLRPDRIIDGPQAAVDVLCEEISDYDREVFCVINVRSDKSVINMNVVSMGTINTSQASPREIFKSSILSNAAAIILLHNHPSGSVVPSKADIDVTYRLWKCGKLLDIQVLDHIIVSGRDPYRRCSFFEEGLLDEEVLSVRPERAEAR